MAEDLRRLRKVRMKQLEREGRKAIGFYREGGKTKPITKKKAKKRKTRAVKKVVPRSRAGRYVYVFEDHTYETQKQARNVL